MSNSGSKLAEAAANLLRVRWFVRAPIGLYHARLGFLLGSRFLMLEHIGRTSGLPRYVVLEVIDQPRPGVYVVVSGFGERAQWLRNVKDEPSVRVQIGSRRPVPATARLLGPDEVAASLEHYATAHPKAWAQARPVFEHTLGARIDERGTDLTMVALETR